MTLLRPSRQLRHRRRWQVLRPAHPAHCTPRYSPLRCPRSPRPPKCWRLRRRFCRPQQRLSRRRRPWPPRPLIVRRCTRPFHRNRPHRQHLSRPPRSWISDCSCRAGTQCWDSATYPPHACSTSERLLSAAPERRPSLGTHTMLPSWHRSRRRVSSPTRPPRSPGTARPPPSATLTPSASSNDWPPHNEYYDDDLAALLACPCRHHRRRTMPCGGSPGSALSRRMTSSASPPVFGTASPCAGCRATRAPTSRVCPAGRAADRAAGGLAVLQRHATPR